MALEHGPLFPMTIDAEDLKPRQETGQAMTEHRRPKAPLIRQRRLDGELMDQPDLNSALHLHALRGLKRLNQVCRSTAIVWPEIALAARRVQPETLQVLDLASGGGDNIIALAQRARREGLRIHFHGCDISDLAVQESRAQATSKGAANVSFSQLDVLEQPLPGAYHVVTCSLFVHHLTEPQVVHLFKKMAAAAKDSVLISDLCRTWFGFALAWGGSRLLTRSPVVHVDGPRSVAAAFTPGEVSQLWKFSGLESASISRRWPQRWLLRWRKH